MPDLSNAVQYRLGQFGDMERYAGMQALMAYEKDAVAAMTALTRHLDRVRAAKELRITQGDTWPACIDQEANRA